MHTCTQNTYYSKRQKAYLENLLEDGSHAIFKLIHSGFMGAHVVDERERERDRERERERIS